MSAFSFRHVLATSIIIPFLSLYGLPQDLQIVAGEAQQRLVDPNHLQISTNDKAILHWKEFSIASHEKVQFVQPSTAAVVLNRVKGSEGSQLLGQLHANGKVYLVNPHGVIFGKDAIIQTAGFLASTHDVSDSDFILNKEMLFQGDSSEAIIHYGTISSVDGDIVLIGRIIENQGSLQALEGTVSIAAGQEILLKMQDRPTLSIRPSLQKDGKITHAGKIEALVADIQAEGLTYSHGINIEGSILALNTVAQNGKIYLKANGVTIARTGTLNAPNGSIDIETADKSLYVEGNICAQKGSLFIKNKASDTPLFNLGLLDVSADQGGTINIETAKLINTGKILAKGDLTEGGSIHIHTEGPYIETSQGMISVEGNTKGGELFLQADTTLFSSGKFSAQGEVGGELCLLSPVLTLASADLDASGQSQGGKIFVGGGAHGESKGAPNALTTQIIGNTHLSVSAADVGDGGFVVIWSDEKTICYGSVEANAGSSSGNGGWIEVSGKNDLHCQASLSSHASNGTPGTILLDPKNITIDAVTGVYPQYELIDPNSGAGFAFGFSQLALSSGNIAVSKPLDDIGGLNAGAAYLYNGNTAELISTLIGSAGDKISAGETPFIPLTNNGNYVIMSPLWQNGANAEAGATTWANGATGVSGVVSSSNSLIGTTAGDGGSTLDVVALTNGNYVVKTPLWDDGGTANVGAVTFGNGTSGISGEISVSISLIGSTAEDEVGFVTALTNGNYVVVSTSWDDGGTANVGAVTFCDGGTGRIGVVSPGNSLIGTTANDQVGFGSVTALTNGNYVVASPFWDDGVTADVGAVTFCDGGTGTTGVVSSGNSLIGTTANDQVGGALLLEGVIALTNDNYVVISPNWTNGANAQAGAVTLGNGGSGTTGTVSSGNSLVGTTAGDLVGSGGVTALTNGNYIVISPDWANGADAQAGAVTLGDGGSGITGNVTFENSLVGSTAGDQVGSGGVTALTSNHYVVSSPNWDDGATADVGAVTFGNDVIGVTGLINFLNSLIGSTAGDQVGSGGVTALVTNNNYIVSSPNWTNGSNAQAGAVTLGNGGSGTTGVLSSANSLVGTTAGDQVGSGESAALTNGNYVAVSPNWNGTLGAATYIDGTTGLIGEVSASNSLVGSNVGDFVGIAAFGLSSGDYVVLSPLWANGGDAAAGAVTWGSGTAGITGIVDTQNSVVGLSASSQLTSIVDDSVNGVFSAGFTDEGRGKVRVGLTSSDQLTFSRAQAQAMTITPSFLTATLDTGSSIILQANNDLTLSSPITTVGAGSLTFSAGRSAIINGNITMANGSLEIIANNLLANGVVDANRDAGAAVLTVGDSVTIQTGTGNLTLSLLDGSGKTNTESGDLTIGTNAILECSGAGVMSLTAQSKSIVLEEDALLRTENGNLILTAGLDITSIGTVNVQSLGTGELVLIADNLFPTAPLFGNGRATIAQARLLTNGGKLLIYTSQRDLNTMPALINNSPYVQGTEFVDSTTEKWGTYFPNSSGIPFTIFYKETGSPNPVNPITPSAIVNNNYKATTGAVGPFQMWANPWYSDLFFSEDSYPPYLTPKGLRLRLPSLVNDPGKPQSTLTERYRQDN